MAVNKQTYPRVDGNSSSDTLLALRHLAANGTAVRNKCDKIDEEIEHLIRLASRLTDQATIEVIEGMIEKMLEEKIQLHPVEALRPPR